MAPTYELVNHVLTFGLDMIWRDKAARVASRSGGRRWLDVCSGTGEMARELSGLAPALAALLHEAGFEPVSYKRSLFGAAAIHLAFKPLE